MAASSDIRSPDLIRPNRAVNKPPDPLLLRAIDAHKGGRLAEAEAGYRRVLRRRRNDADALNFLGMLHVQRGEPAQGVALLRDSVRSASRNPHAWVNLGNALVAVGDDTAAAQAFRTATELAPTMAEAWFNRGVCLRRMKQPEQALECFGKAVEHGPGYAAAHEAMGSLLYRAGRAADAAESYRLWLRHDPDNAFARHMLAATSGEDVPLRADDRYLAKLFDDFASTFDENLQELGYRAPQLLADIVKARIGEHGAREVLDAGCGTGLCAPLLRPLASRLAGVDISPGMIDKARARGGYDELVVQELTSFMRARTDAFDLIISADTLVYFGALKEPLMAAQQCLRTGGLLAFTVERLADEAAGAGYRIEPHGRYSHREDYVREVLAQAGFSLQALEAAVLRRERGQDVSGHVVLAMK